MKGSLYCTWVTHGFMRNSNVSEAERIDISDGPKAKANKMKERMNSENKTKEKQRIECTKNEGFSIIFLSD